MVFAGRDTSACKSVAQLVRTFATRYAVLGNHFAASQLSLCSPVAGDKSGNSHAIATKKLDWINLAQHSVQSGY